MSLKIKIENRLNELKQAEIETEVQLWAIRGAIQELEQVTLPMIEEAEDNEPDIIELTNTE